MKKPKMILFVPDMGDLYIRDWRESFALLRYGGRL